MEDLANLSDDDLAAAMAAAFEDGDMTTGEILAAEHAARLNADGQRMDAFVRHFYSEQP